MALTTITKSNQKRRQYVVNTSREALRKRLVILNHELYADCPKCSWLGGPYSNEQSGIASLYSHIKERHLIK